MSLGILSGPLFHMGQVLDTYKNNPEQALLGINTPAESKIWNEALGTNYQPVVNMYGGPTAQDYSLAQQQGVPMTANHIADATAKAFTGYATMGGSTLGEMAVRNKYDANGQNPQVMMNYAHGGAVMHPHAMAGLYALAQHLQRGGR
jgi:hypothetical protein